MSGLPTGSVAEVPTGSVAEVPTGSVAGVPTGSVAGVPTGSVAGVPTGSVPGVPTGSVKEPPVYITISGPEYEDDDDTDYEMINDPNLQPYTFGDECVLKSESTLQTMSKPELINYSTSMSTCIGYENSTIRANQDSINQYTILISESERIISQLGDEIFKCEVDYALEDIRFSTLTDEDYTYDSTLSSFTQQIADNSDNIIEIEQNIKTYERESEAAVLEEEKEWEGYNKSTIAYNILKGVYLSKKQYYDDTLAELSTAKSKLSTAYFFEGISYQTMNKTAKAWQDAYSTLEGEIGESTLINDDIARCKIRVTKATKEYTSTCDAASSLSSLYRAAGANYEYAISLSSLNYLANEYASADSNFTLADIAYQNSLPSGSQGGGGDQTLLTIRSMAQQQLYQISTQMFEVKKKTDTLQTIAGIAETDAYALLLIEYQKNIDSSMRRINTLETIKKKSQEEVRQFSAAYDNATLEIEAQTSLLSTISTLYISSVEGTAKIVEKNRLADEDYSQKMVKYNTDSYTLRNLRGLHASSMSSLDGWTQISTLKRKALEEAISELSTISSLYLSSQMTIDTYTEDLITKREQKSIDNKNLFIQSSLLRKSEIELEDYLTSRLNSINNQEWSAYEYRQTFCQELSVRYRDTYHSLVLGAVEYAATQNQINTSVGGVPVAPAPINLNTVQLSNAYLSLTNINTFINSFNTLFKEYNRQSSNIAAMSTSVGYEYYYWNNFQESSVALLSKNTPYVQELTSTSLGVFENSAKTFTDISGVVYSEIKTIKLIKDALFQNYSTFFTPEEIEAQNTTISSFIIKGMAQASTLLGGMPLEEPIQIQGPSGP